MSNITFAIRGIGVVLKRLVNVKMIFTFFKDLSSIAFCLGFVVLALSGFVFLVIKLLAIGLRSQRQTVSDPSNFFGVPLISHISNFLNDINAQMSDSMFFKVGAVCFSLWFLKSLIDSMFETAPAFVRIYRYLVVLGKGNNH